MPARRKSRLEPGRLLAAARQSAALLRAISPNRRMLSDLVDEICCPICEMWVRPRRFLPVANACTRCAIVLDRRGWSR